MCDKCEWEVVLAYALQGEHQLSGLQMPLANQRAPNGHLFCQEAADVPDKTVLPLKFPVHLGSLSLPVSVRLDSDNSKTAELHDAV